MAIQLKIEMEFSGRGNGWTDVSSDVNLASECEGSRGIRGQGPRDRVASTGVLTFALKNHAGNSGGLQGYYTPGHDNVRSGFGRNTGVRASVIIGSSTIVLWTGAIRKIEPTTGQYLEQLSHVTCYDYMDRLARHKIDALDVKQNRAEHEAFSDIIAEVGVQPRAIDVSDGPDTYPYVFDLVRDEETAPLTELQRLAQSSLAYIYLQGDGTLVYEPRTVRALPEDPVVELAESDLHVLDRPQVEDNEDELTNKVETITAPRRTDGSTVVLARANQPVKVESGGPYQVRLLFTDPGQRAFRAGGINLVDPLVASTDYVFNTASDGSGTDVTGQVSVSATFSGNAVILAITNNSGATAWATTLQARGEGVYGQEELVLSDTDDDSISAIGENAVTFEMPYQDDAPTARNVAQYLLHVFSQDQKRTRQVPLMLQQVSEARAELFARRDIGDRVSITETMTALDGTEFFINAVDFHAKADGTFWLKWTPVIADATDFWFLGVVGFSELGQTTRLGFGLVVGHTDVAHGDTHSDSAHADVLHDDAHTDTAHGDTGHGDTGHSDSHSDSAHSDTHSDTAHSDVAHADAAHADSHSDTSHVDTHGDTAHTDSHTDDAHSDVAHSDNHADLHADHTDGVHQDNPYNDSHTDAAHSDSAHGDSHSDVTHDDTHSDTAHADTHNDTAHSDSHTDTAHDDSHTDVSHGDSHTDTAHTDAAHTDSAHADTHTDVSHSDTTHGDSHSDEAHGDAN